jgi:hypothetical protein
MCRALRCVVSSIAVCCVVHCLSLKVFIVVFECIHCCAFLIFKYMHTTIAYDSFVNTLVFL